ncbi:ATP-binding protein [Salegentibacter sp.]|uniref:GAF domain-containing sensor histidine kinase n=1 Tax=Salegentibacter sp. TaxID=1903072 RepID=UPI00356681AE
MEINFSINRPISKQLELSKEQQEEIESIKQIPIVSKLLDVICRTTGMGFAAIARVSDQAWITCAIKDEIAFGLEPGDELDVKTTICHEVRLSREAVFIDHVEKDVHYCKHPTPIQYGFQSYVSYPIFRKDGSFFGTLCAIDPNPTRVNTPEIKNMFDLFSELISFHLNAVEEIKISANELADEKQNSDLREQFIAILGHDLKNPLATTRMSADLLLKVSDNEIVKRQAGIIKSTSFRMAGLIENILDFARGRLGQGIVIERQPCRDSLQKTLKQVVKEVDIMAPGRNIDLKLEIEDDVDCDENRIAQLFSNLLANAVIHGSEEHSIDVFASSKGGEFMLSVSNGGDKIPDSAKKHLFQPFYREDVKPGKQGLGLGLFITSEIALAHGGKMEVNSTDEQTKFIFRMPLKTKD